MTKPRLIPSWPLPEYIFIPGVNAHPSKMGGHMHGKAEPHSDPIDLSHPEKSDFLRFALDLYNHGYYWESHVYFEALWNAHKRTGSASDFFKAMIKLGAGGVKINLEQMTAASGHFDRAVELFLAVKKEEGKFFLGFDLEKIIQEIETKFKSELKCFPIYPAWS